MDKPRRTGSAGVTKGMNKKKIRYIKIKEEQPKKRSSKKSRSRAAKNFGHAMTIVGTTFSAMLLILVIMVCIVATVLAVYVLDFADNSYDANLKDVEMKYTSFVYGYDEDNELVEIKRLAAEQNRVWVDYEDMPKCLIDAVVASEDKRFYTHKGVDWYRTAGAFFSNGDSGGGSTITQQLIKNLTGDKEVSWERKLREIFRALSLEEKYTKIDILESYLNQIWFNGMVYGVGAASEYYFGKDVSDINIGEAAVLAGMIRNPSKMSPYYDLARSKQQQNYSLRCMYEQGMITTKEYEDYRLNRIQVHFAKPVYGDDYGYIDERTLTDSTDDSDLDAEVQDKPYRAYKWNGDYEVSQDWYVDAAIDQVINDFADLKGITYTSAKNELYNGGYKIYINENMKLQKILEEKYRDPYTVLSYYNENAAEKDLIQSAFIVIDYTGTVQAVVGGLGEKPGDGAFNRDPGNEIAGFNDEADIHLFAGGAEESHHIFYADTRRGDKHRHAGRAADMAAELRRGMGRRNAPHCVVRRSALIEYAGGKGRQNEHHQGNVHSAHADARIYNAGGVGYRALAAVPRCAD